MMDRTRVRTVTMVSSVFPQRSGRTDRTSRGSSYSSAPGGRRCPMDLVSAATAIATIDVATADRERISERLRLVTRLLRMAEAAEIACNLRLDELGRRRRQPLAAPATSHRSAHLDRCVGHGPHVGAVGSRAGPGIARSTAPSDRGPVPRPAPGRGPRRSRAATSVLPSARAGRPGVAAPVVQTPSRSAPRRRLAAAAPRRSQPRRPTSRGGDHDHRPTEHPVGLTAPDLRMCSPCPRRRDHQPPPDAADRVAGSSTP